MISHCKLLYLLLIFNQNYLHSISYDGRNFGSSQKLDHSSRSVAFRSSVDKSDTIKVIYMDENCKEYFFKNQFKSISVLRSIIVKVVNLAKMSLQRSMTCVVTFSAVSPHEKLLLHFESLDIDYNPGTTDKLHIHDGPQALHQNQLSPLRGLYGNYVKGDLEYSSGGIHDYRTSQAFMTLFFEGSPSAAFSGFRALLTSFRDPLKNKTCPPAYFYCSVSKICISITLKCDGYQNCGEGDISDEHSCDTNMGESTQRFGFKNSADIALIAGCAVSIVILMSVMLWLVFVCVKKARVHRSRRQRISTPNRRRYEQEEVDGVIVEPVQPTRFLPSPPYYEPPPMYTENDNAESAIQYQCIGYEPPPPYSLNDYRMENRISNDVYPNHTAENCARFIPPTNHLPNPHSDCFPSIYSNNNRVIRDLCLTNSCHRNCMQNSHNVTENDKEKDELYEDEILDLAFSNNCT